MNMVWIHVLGAHKDQQLQAGRDGDIPVQKKSAYLSDNGS